MLPVLSDRAKDLRGHGPPRAGGSTDPVTTWGRAHRTRRPGAQMCARRIGTMAACMGTMRFGPLWLFLALGCASAPSDIPDEVSQGGDPQRGNSPLELL